MTFASTDQLLTYLADLVEELERFGVTLLPPDDRDEITLGKEPDGSLVIDFEGRCPVSRRSKDVVIELFERWRPTGPDEWACVEYQYEIRHHEMRYRRAFHRHDADDFVRTHAVATHEHCEAAMGVEVCRHYYGEPVADAFDGFHRLYDGWLSGQAPDCGSLVCLD